MVCRTSPAECNLQNRETYEKQSQGWGTKIVRSDLSAGVFSRGRASTKAFLPGATAAAARSPPVYRPCTDGNAKDAPRGLRHLPSGEPVLLARDAQAPRAAPSHRDPLRRGSRFHQQRPRQRRGLAPRQRRGQRQRGQDAVRQGRRDRSRRCRPRQPQEAVQVARVVPHRGTRRAPAIDAVTVFFWPRAAARGRGASPTPADPSIRPTNAPAR